MNIPVALLIKIEKEIRIILILWFIIESNFKMYKTKIENNNLNLVFKRGGYSDR